jgi:hypothetical protein
MANNYSISFKSLRSKAVYTVNIGGGTGNAIPLKGAAQPFSTQEDATDDMFTPMRLQSGYLRIIDDGYDDNGNAFDWHDLIPATDTSRPIALTGVDAGGNSLGVLWQGFMQAQTFSGELYAYSQVREFPVQCILSALNGTNVATNIGLLCNFAYLINYAFSTLPSSHRPTSYVFQGGADAQTILLKRFDWSNLLSMTDDGAKARFNVQQALEDVCRFWGWTCRTHRQTAYFACADDAGESNALVLTDVQLATMAGGTAAGTTEAMFSTLTLPDAFASTANDDIQMRGPGKAVVKVDVNEMTDIIKFAPYAAEQVMAENGYTWVQGSEDLVGYFTTQPISQFEVDDMNAYSLTATPMFCRRQIFTSESSEDGTEVDVILIKKDTSTPYPMARLETTVSRSFSGGSFKMRGQFFRGSKNLDENPGFYMRFGIGESRATAKWFDLYGTNQQGGVAHEWSSTEKDFAVSCIGGTMCPSCLVAIGTDVYGFNSSYIPADDALYGKLYVEFFSCQSYEDFEIGNFEVEFTRDMTVFPTNYNTKRARTMKEKRITAKEYTAVANNKNLEEWNANCIYASDNNMEIGAGLIMNPDGTFMATTAYNGVQEHPEQHLANRVAAYWLTSKRHMDVEIQSQALASGVAVGDISPRHKLSIDSSTLYPVSVSHEWRDDRTNITMLQL